MAAVGQKATRAALIPDQPLALAMRAVVQPPARQLAAADQRAAVQARLAGAVEDLEGEAIGRIGQVVGATPKDIVSDAVSKKEKLSQYIRELDAEVEEENAVAQAEIERLQAEIAANQEKIKALTSKKAAAIPVCQERMNLLDQVISFFDYDENTLNAPEPVAVEDIGTDPDEMPAFMREDAVRRMLGINEEFMDENGEFDAMKFAQKYGDGTEPEPGNEEVGAGNARRRTKK